MPPEIQQDQALELKKRARRRLVGAIALVLLMIIILPMILKDRDVPEAVKEDVIISMPEAAPAPVASNVAPLPSPLPNTSLPVEPTTTFPAVTTLETTPASKPSETVVVTPEPVEVMSPEVKATPEVVVTPEVKVTEAKPVIKGNDYFTIQIGVFSDPANVAQLQSKLKAAGQSHRTEKINTPNGEKTRLRVGKYATRQEAADALSKLGSAGISGMVITNK